MRCLNILCVIMHCSDDTANFSLSETVRLVDDEHVFDRYVGVERSTVRDTSH